MGADELAALASRREALSHFTECWSLALRYGEPSLHIPSPHFSPRGAEWAREGGDEAAVEWMGG